MYDLIVIGSGPAGITASVYAARKRLDLLVVSKDIGGQAAWSGEIENYTGYQFISGPELVAKFQEHLNKYNITVRENEAVTSLVKDWDVCLVNTDKGQYKARSVIIASGKRTKVLNVPGEEEFKNRGLTYCATCDGPLFAGKDVAVVGGGNSALDAVLQLMRIARHIYLINIGSQLTGDPVMLDEIFRSPGLVTILNQSQVSSINGDKFVRNISVKKDGAEQIISVEGVFVEIGLLPNSEFAPLVAQNELKEIKVDCWNQTNVPGIFAAGDVTDVPEKQIIIAAGEGAKASLSAFRYFVQHKF